MPHGYKTFIHVCRLVEVTAITLISIANVILSHPRCLSASNIIPSTAGYIQDKMLMNIVILTSPIIIMEF